jgi:hypothetical protein
VKPFEILLAGALLAAVAGCGSSPAAPQASPAPAPMPLNLTGTWTGTGTDGQGPETFKMTLTQMGERVTGTVVLDPGNPNDGTCGSCHKQKAGTFSGTVSGSTLTLTMDFPRGGDDLTPLCGLTMNAVTSDVVNGRIASRYTGTTTCEGPITDGTLVVTR